MGRTTWQSITLQQGRHLEGEKKFMKNKIYLLISNLRHEKNYSKKDFIDFSLKKKIEIKKKNHHN